MLVGSVKMAAAGVLAVGLAAGLAPAVAAPAPTAASASSAAPFANYPPKVKKAKCKPKVGSGGDAVWVKVRPKVNKKFYVKVQIKKNGKWFSTGGVYRTDKKKQKVKIPVKPGKYRFRVISRKVGKDVYLGTTSKVVKVKK